MSRFYFQLLDGISSDMIEVEYDLDSFEAAKTEARRTLGEMARESLSGDTVDMISVEILDDSHRPLLEVRLLLQEIPKVAQT